MKKFILMSLLTIVATVLSFIDISAGAVMFGAPLTFAGFLETKDLTETSFAEKDDSKEVAKLYMEFNDAIRKEIFESVANSASKDEVALMNKTLSENIDRQFETLNKIIETQGLMIVKNDKSGDETVKSTNDMLTEQKDALETLKSGKSKADVVIKVVGTMTVTGNASGGDVPQAFREAGLNRIADRLPRFTDTIIVTATDRTVVEWVEQQNREGVTGGTAEGVLKNQIDFDIVVVSENMVKRTNFIKVSDEMVDDIPFMSAEINNELMTLLGLDVDDQAINGDGAGSNLNGAVTQATAYGAGSFAGAIDQANNWDVLMTAINQVIVANHVPNAILMNTSDVTAMNLTKGTDGHYVLPPFQSAEGLTVSGIRIIPTTGIAVDNFLVYDGRKATMYVRQNMDIAIGLDGDDFTKNLRTIRNEWRGLLRIKGNDTTAFVTGDFTTAKAALETA